MAKLREEIMKILSGTPGIVRWGDADVMANELEKLVLSEKKELLTELWETGLTDKVKVGEKVKGMYDPKTVGMAVYNKLKKLGE